MADGLSLFVVEKTSLLDGAHLAARFSCTHHTVDSVQDMVNYVNKQAAANGKVRRLYIQGHGAPGVQAVGAGSTTEDMDGTLTIALDDNGELCAKTAQILAGMKSAFTDDAIITFGGCAVAATTDHEVEWDAQGMRDNLAYARQRNIPVSQLGHQKIPGTRLLREVSKALGGRVKVQAGTGKQYYMIPGMQGTVWRCDASHCVNMGSGWWSVPD